MTKISKIIRLACLAAMSATIVILAGGTASAQRDPFKKAGWAVPKKVVAPGSKAASAGPVNYGPPPIEARIEYYKRIREQAAAAGNLLPKVTSVLTLNEMTVSGIFKTPRGWAAMVQAVPIKLSYTIYPGEKFFDGQLVAVEENRLVFKRVTKTGPGKFVASVENKPLRQFSIREQVAGTAPEGSNSGKEAEVVAAANQQANQQAEGANASAPSTAKAVKPQTVNPFLSPLDEMNSQPEKKDTEKKVQKKPAKVARNGK